MTSLIAIALTQSRYLFYGQHSDVFHLVPTHAKIVSFEDLELIDKASEAGTSLIEFLDTLHNFGTKTITEGCIAFALIVA